MRMRHLSLWSECELRLATCKAETVDPCHFECSCESFGNPPGEWNVHPRSERRVVKHGSDDEASNRDDVSNIEPLVEAISDGSD